ncbi:signal peptidase I [Brochothrix campestris]|uniref:Signal peptidase I n=1 Tax=Brochothrix campestris FSL F6-1037 TaxID=1265861 RepID=W7CZ04_9LIST|nr:signal peptidase I [Brochothrix campestris]EUJ42202.1 signal peptidase I [Brochothrix campestris FSL F6-1037]
MNKTVKSILEIVKIVVIALALTFVIRTYLFAVVKVDGASMDPTLHDGQYLALNKLKTANRFDIVVFPAPNEGKGDYIKRVIGLPGDKIVYKDDRLYINDKAYQEPYLDEFKAKVNGRLTDDFVIDELPEDSYFLMGDNRRISNDSRRFGPVEQTDIEGVILNWLIRS